MPNESTRIELTVDGEQFVIRMSDLTALDAKDFRLRVGVSLVEVFVKESGDLDIIAGLLWLAKRKRDPRLRYEDVARQLTYDTDIEFGGEDEAVDDTTEGPDGTADPEA